MSKKPPDMSEIMEFDKTTFADTLLKCSDKEKSESNHTPKFLTESTGQSGLPKISIGSFQLVALSLRSKINLVLS